MKPLLEGVLARQDRPDGHPDGAPKNDEKEEYRLLPCRHLAQIDRVESCLGHGADDDKQAVRVADAPCRAGRAPEDERGGQADEDKIGIVNCDEIQGREPSSESRAPRGAACAVMVEVVGPGAHCGREFTQRTGPQGAARR